MNARNYVRHNEASYIKTRIRNLTTRIEQNEKLLALNPANAINVIFRDALTHRLSLDRKVLSGWQAKLDAVEPPAPKGGDATLLDQWAKITDPREALRTIVKHEDFLGYDPYYKDLRAALLAMADRCSEGGVVKGRTSL
jgi:hypothetical protein